MISNTQIITNDTANELVKTVENEKLTCPICYLEIENNELFKLPCNHSYHLNCLRQNYSSCSGTRGICPYCRLPYNTNIHQHNKIVINIGDTVTFPIKIQGQNVISQGCITHIMPNTVKVMSWNGNIRRVNKNLLTKIEGFKVFKPSI
tara:strand:- start:2745 stop:3188 length:444 start_codon:yes stop_codon:yes gene_type:complete